MDVTLKSHEKQPQQNIVHKLSFNNWHMLINYVVIIMILDLW